MNVGIAESQSSMLTRRARGGALDSTALEPAAPALQMLRGLTLAEQREAVRPDGGAQAPGPQAIEAPGPQSIETPAPDTQAPAGEAAAPEADAQVTGGLKSSRLNAIEALQQVAAGLVFVRRGSPYRDAVSAIQAVLTATGFDCGPNDGLFGSQTDSALRRFQGANGLAPDGVVGPLTLGAIDAGDEGIGQSNQADTRLKHNTKIINDKNRDPERGSGINEPNLPFQDGGDWDGAAILAYWSQEDNDSDVTTTDSVRCAVNAAMAVRIMSGPAAVVAFTRAAMTEGERLMAAPTTNAVQANNIALTLPTMLWPLAELEASIRVFQGPPLFGIDRVALASYRSLDAIANAVKIMLTLNPHGLASIGVSDTNPNPTPEAENIFTLGTGKSRQGSFPIRIASRDHMMAFVDALRPGEAWLLAVDLHQGDPRLVRNDYKVAELDHGITVGREPLNKGGRIYLYDPAPKEGSQIFFLKDARDSAAEVGFWPYFEVPGALTGGSSVFKHTLVLQATQAG